MSGAQESGPNYVQRVLRLAWPSLGMILVSSVIVCVGGIVVAFIGGGITPLSLTLWGVVVGPLFATLVAQINEMLRTRSDPPVFSFFRYLGRAWKTGVVLGLIPAVTGSLLLIELDISAQTKSWLPLIPAAVSGSVTVLAGLTYMVGVPLGFVLPRLNGRELALMGLHVAARRPVPLIGAIALIVIAVLVSAQFSTALILLLPGPLAVVLVSGVWTSAYSLGLIAEETEEP